MKLKIDGFLMYGNYTEEQIDRIANEMNKPKDNRKYLYGIEFSRINQIEVIAN